MRVLLALSIKVRPRLYGLCSSLKGFEYLIGSVKLLESFCRWMAFINSMLPKSFCTTCSGYENTIAKYTSSTKAYRIRILNYEVAFEYYYSISQIT
jgi:hypothetical protein